MTARSRQPLQTRDYPATNLYTLAVDLNLRLFRQCPSKDRRMSVRLSSR